MSNLKIEHRIARDNLGNTDDAYAAEYVAALTAALQSEYPDADVLVNLKSDFANACQTIVTNAPSTGPDDDDTAISENVKLIANLVWERM